MSAARSGARRPWRRSPSCASARPTTSRSGSASSRPAPTTSWPSRSTPGSSRRGSRRCCSASSGRTSRRRPSRDGAHRRRAAGQADRRRVQPQGRRGDHDDRREPGPGAGAQGTRQGLHHRPRPPVRRRSRRTSTWRRARRSSTSSATSPRSASPSSCAPTPRATTPASTSSRRRPPPRSRAGHGRARRQDPDDHQRDLRHGRHRRRVHAGRAHDDRVRARRRRSCCRSIPEIAALKAVHSLLDYLTDTGSVGAKALFVLNNMFAKEILRLRDVESALGTKISADLPYDPFLYLKAVNEGIPVVRGAPRTPPAEQAAAAGDDGVRGGAARSGRERRRRDAGPRREEGRPVRGPAPPLAVRKRPGSFARPRVMRLAASSADGHPSRRAHAHRS